MYSTLAGFLEPGETIEEATRREAWEEAGVTLNRVVLHSTQPWPYPANLMVGAIGQAAPGEDSKAPDLGNDAELEHADWFKIEDVRNALKGAEWNEKGIGASDPTGDAPAGVKLKLPPRTAIAHQLMEAVCNGGFVGGTTKI
jgi:NAD+ diphosphatase